MKKRGYAERSGSDGGAEGLEKIEQKGRREKKKNEFAEYTGIEEHDRSSIGAERSPGRSGWARLGRS